jgi:acetyl esterase/lipase
MSPWVSLTTKTLSYVANSTSDIFSARTWAYFASDILKKLPEDGRPYLEAVKAPKDWWKGIDKVVKKITILTGALECMRDDNMSLATQLERHLKDVTLFVQHDGVHTEPFLAKMAGEEDQPEIYDLLLKHFL